jgi:MoaA/NifB/PqqE/SkfB family radical SAM enzyme
MYKVTSWYNHEDAIKIEWNLGKRCNYDCSYCPSSIHDNTSPHTELEILESTIDKLSTLPHPVRLSFTGGEPCVHPYIDNVLEYCKRQGIAWINLTTNGTRPAHWYVGNEQFIDHIVFSLHFEHDWQRVVDTILEVKRSSKMTIMVNVMAHHDYMRNVMAVAQRLRYSDVPYVIRRVRWTEGNHDLFDDLRYNANDLEWIKEHTASVHPNVNIWSVIDGQTAQQPIHANDVIKLHLNQFKDWKCNAGLESLMINWDGEVHRATCRVGGSLGNIYTGTFNVPTEPIICDRNFCTCAADIPLTKEKQ